MRRETSLANTGDQTKGWKIVDAADIPLGRLAVVVARALQGKNRPDWTPHVDGGDFVIITNATKVALTGKKAEQRLKTRYSGYPGGLKAETYGQVRERKPEKLVSDAVRRMLPKNRMARVQLSNMYVFADGTHPYAEKNPQTMAVL